MIKPKNIQTRIVSAPIKGYVRVEAALMLGADVEVQISELSALKSQVMQRAHLAEVEHECRVQIWEALYKDIRDEVKELRDEFAAAALTTVGQEVLARFNDLLSKLSVGNPEITLVKGNNDSNNGQKPVTES